MFVLICNLALFPFLFCPIITGNDYLDFDENILRKT